MVADAAVSSGGSGGPVPAIPDCASPAAGSYLPKKHVFYTLNP